MAMWLVSLNRKKKGHDNHAPQRVEKVRFILQNHVNSTYCKNRVGLISVAHQAHQRLRARRLISTAAKPNSAVSTHSGQLPVRAYGVSPVVGVTLVVNTSRVNCGIIA
ncbi:ybl25 [Escherichia coli BL21(DE3)]|nr:hypothetical protein B5762_00673 [Escherichia coli]CAQ31132.2 ybl25 [Escherichia coli BL21(DE3)]